MTLETKVNPAEQSRQARERNRKTIKVIVIANGYLLYEGEGGDTYSYPTREELHRHVDRFLDQLEDNGSRGEVSHDPNKFRFGSVDTKGRQ